MVDKHSGDSSGSWCADSGIGSSSSIATVSSEKLSPRIDSAAAAAGSRQHAADDNGDDYSDYIVNTTG